MSSDLLTEIYLRQGTAYKFNILMTHPPCEETVSTRLDLTFKIDIIFVPA